MSEKGKKERITSEPREAGSTDDCVVRLERKEKIISRFRLEQDSADGN